MAETNYDIAQGLLGQIDELDPANPASTVAGLYAIGYALLAVVDQLRAQQSGGSGG